MNKYKVKYVIHTEFLAKNDEEACKIDEKNLNAILGNGEFLVTKFKLERRVTDNVDTDAEQTTDNKQ